MTDSVDAPTPTQERLLQLLDIREQALEVANDRVYAVERQLKEGVDWMFQRHARQDEFNLPSPRLQLRLVEDDGYVSEWAMELVHKDRGGTFGAVPLGFSKRSGGNQLSLPETVLTEKDQRDVSVYLPTLVNDLCFAHEAMGLPGYVLVEERILKVVSLRPLAFEEIVPLDAPA